MSSSTLDLVLAAVGFALLAIATFGAATLAKATKSMFGPPPSPSEAPPAASPDTYALATWEDEGGAGTGEGEPIELGRVLPQ